MPDPKTQQTLAWYTSLTVGKRSTTLTAWERPVGTGDMLALCLVPTKAAPSGVTLMGRGFCQISLEAPGAAHLGGGPSWLLPAALETLSACLLFTSYRKLVTAPDNS